MSEPIDEHFTRQVRALAEDLPDPAHDAATASTRAELLELFRAEAQARHLDLAARWLRSKDLGFYTIGSAGHESNAAVAMALRPSDPALLHYRSGGFYAARAAQVPGSTPIRDVLLGLAASSDDPISHGRHKVFGHPGLAIIPQTSTIASHLPRAVGLAFGIDQRTALGVTSEWPQDAVVVCSFGDASANHSTAVGALNAAAYLRYRGVRLPLLFVCEDNGLGISTRTPSGWPERALPGYGLDYMRVDGTDPEGLLAVSRELAGKVRATRRPAVLHLKTVRFMGHAGSDAELAYRTRADIERDYARDPLLATAHALVRLGMSPGEVLADYEALRVEVMSAAASLQDTPRLTTAAAVMEPLTARRPVEVALAARTEPVRSVAASQSPTRVEATRSPTGVGTTQGPTGVGTTQGPTGVGTTQGPTGVGATQGPTGVGGTPSGGFTLAQTINSTLADVLAAHPSALVFGEDVAVKGGVYGVTRGLRKRFGGRVFDTMLDEQTILGTALGTALAGFLPIPEIQYLAYLHNAEDQLRGEGASLRFFSAGQYGNGMVVRVAGLAYQLGFGGHFHNDNSVAVLRDIPGLVLAVPAHPGDAAGLLRTCVGLAVAEQRVCVYLEPIARYHTRDLAAPGDGAWLAPYRPAREWDSTVDGLGRVRRHGAGRDLLIVTYGNGLYLSLRALPRLEQLGIAATVLDLRWLSPLPQADLLAAAADFDRVLVVDECRRSGGIAEPVIALLVDDGFAGRIARVTSQDSFIPLGPAADTVLLGEDDIVEAAAALAAR